MKRHGFTLLELLIAMGLVVILAAIAVGGMFYASGRADEAATLATMKEFEMALEKFKSEQGYYPVVKTAAPVDFSDSAWKKFRKGGYLSGDYDKTIKDAYDGELWYQCPGAFNKGKYDLWSMGLDGMHGDGSKEGRSDNATDIKHAGEEGCDDLCSWQQH